MNDVDFSWADFNLHKIDKESGLSNLETENKYRIYGLKDDGNPLVLIRCPKNKFHPNKRREIIRFFGQNRIQVKFEDFEIEKIWVGLRWDLRKSSISLCSAIVQTIIYSLEGKINLPRKITLKGIPRFKIEEKE